MIQLKQRIMKFTIQIILTSTILFLGLNLSYSQNGTIEAVDGVIVGNNTGNTDGTIRYTGNDFEGRKNGSWTSLSAAGSSMWSDNNPDISYNLGNVGVGTASPLKPLHVNGSYEILRLSGTSPWIGIREDGQTNYGYNWMDSGDLHIGVTQANDITFSTDGSQKMRITDQGRVGVGTSSPGAKLHIKHDFECLRLDGATPSMRFFDNGSYNGYVSHDGTNLQMGIINGGKILFYNGGSGARMAIQNNGWVGIQTSSPSATLDVRGSAIFNEHGHDKDFRVEGDNNAHMIFVDASQNRVGIGKSNPQATLDVNGRIRFGGWIESGGGDDIRVSGGIKPITNGSDDLGVSNFKWRDIWAQNGTIQTSDRTLKKDIEDIPYGLTEVMALKPVRFRWKEGDDQDLKLGLIAQETLPILSEVVKTHYYEKSTESGVATKVKVDKLGVYYTDIVPVLIKGMQEQQSEIESLREELKKLNQVVNNLSESLANNQ